MRNLRTRASVGDPILHILHAQHNMLLPSSAGVTSQTMEERALDLNTAVAVSFYRIVQVETAPWRSATLEVLMSAGSMRAAVTPANAGIHLGVDLTRVFTTLDSGFHRNDYSCRPGNILLDHVMFA